MVEGVGFRVSGFRVLGRRVQGNPKPCRDVWS